MIDRLSMVLPIAKRLILGIVLCGTAGCHDFTQLSRNYHPDAATDGPLDGPHDGPPMDGPPDAPFGSIIFSDGFQAFPPTQTWTDASTHGDWQCVFTGTGSVSIATSDTQVMQLLSPTVSGSNTNSALIQTVPSFGDLDFQVRLKTVAQRRTGTSPPPNAWEVAWIDWHYTDNSHLYYFIPKSVGWELGKVVFNTQTSMQEQRFLATGTTPTFPIGAWYTIRIRQVGATISIWADGTHLVDFTDTNGPYLNGSIVFYEEDAQAQWDDLVVHNPF